MDEVPHHPVMGMNIHGDDVRALASQIGRSKKDARKMLVRDYFNEKVKDAKTIDELKPLLYELIEELYR